jgi:hypothetical protein
MKLISEGLQAAPPHLTCIKGPVGRPHNVANMGVYHD